MKIAMPVLHIPRKAPPASCQRNSSVQTAEHSQCKVVFRPNFSIKFGTVKHIWNSGCRQML